MNRHNKATDHAYIEACREYKYNLVNGIKGSKSKVCNRYHISHSFSPFFDNITASSTFTDEDVLQWKQQMQQYYQDKKNHPTAPQKRMHGRKAIEVTDASAAIPTAPRINTAAKQPVQMDLFEAIGGTPAPELYGLLESIANSLKKMAAKL